MLSPGTQTIVWRRPERGGHRVEGVMEGNEGRGATSVTLSKIKITFLKSPFPRGPVAVKQIMLEEPPCLVLFLLNLLGRLHKDCLCFKRLLM